MKQPEGMSHFKAIFWSFVIIGSPMFRQALMLQKVLRPMCLLYYRLLHSWKPVADGS